MRRSFLLVVPLVLIGCGEKEPPVRPSDTSQAAAPLTATDVTARTEPIVDRMVSVAVASRDVVSDTSAWALLDDLTSDDAPVATPPDVPPQAPSDGIEPGGSDDLDPAELAAELNDFLRETVLNEEHLESSTGNSAIFRVTGQDLCGVTTVCAPCPTDDPSCLPDCTSETDPECVELVDAIEIRVRATEVGEDGLDVALLIGPQRFEPLASSVRPDSLIADVDLGQGKLALEHVVSLLPEDETTIVPRVLEGKLHAALTITGDDSFSLVSAVVQAVALEIDTDLGTIAADIGIANPMSELVIDGAQELLGFDIDVGAIDVSLPWALLSEDESDVGAAAIHLAGVSLAALLSADDDSVTITDIGLGDGPSTVKKDATTLFQLDVNPAAGRRLDLSMSPTQLYDSMLFAVAPELNVVAAFNLLPVLDDFPEIESFLWNETYELRLWGAGGASVVPVPSDETYDGGLHVASGTLQLSSTAATAPVTVMAGQCLSAVEPAEEAHPVLDSLAATPCP